MPAAIGQLAGVGTERGALRNERGCGALLQSGIVGGTTSASLDASATCLHRDEYFEGHTRPHLRRRGRQRRACQHRVSCGAGPCHEHASGTRRSAHTSSSQTVASRSPTSASAHRPRADDGRSARPLVQAPEQFMQSFHHRVDVYGPRRAYSDRRRHRCRAAQSRCTGITKCRSRFQHPRRRRRPRAGDAAIARALAKTRRAFCRCVGFARRPGRCLHDRHRPPAAGAVAAEVVYSLPVASQHAPTSASAPTRGAAAPPGDPHTAAALRTGLRGAARAEAALAPIGPLAGVMGSAPARDCTT